MIDRLSRTRDSNNFHTMQFVEFNNFAPNFIAFVRIQKICPDWANLSINGFKLCQRYISPSIFATVSRLHQFQHVKNL